MTSPSGARVERYGVMNPSGCIVQALGIGLGLIVFFLIPVLGWVLGPLAAIWLLIVGGRMAVTYRCSSCKNPVANKQVRVCPACRAPFV